jgi:CDP-diacylglycerol--serine O-phosphatidyltransferase
MASQIPHFSGKSIGRVPREYVAVVLFGLAAGVLLLANFPMEMLVALSLAYLASIPFAVRRFQRLRRIDAAAAPG